jgi:hypothetical protein
LKNFAAEHGGLGFPDAIRIVPLIGAPLYLALMSIAMFPGRVMAEDASREAQ